MVKIRHSTYTRRLWSIYRERIPNRWIHAACIAQLKDGYIKGDRTKHILPKFFFTHDLQKNGDVRVVQVRSSDNLADLFTKALPTSTFKKVVHLIGLRRLKDLDVCIHEGK